MGKESALTQRRAAYDEERARIREVGDPVKVLTKIAKGHMIKQDVVLASGEVITVSKRPSITQMLTAAKALVDKVLPSLKAHEVDVHAKVDHAHRLDNQTLEQIAAGNRAVDAPYIVEEGKPKSRERRLAEEKLDD